MATAKKIGINLRLHPSLHQQLVAEAEKAEASLNSTINSLLAMALRDKWILLKINQQVRAALEEHRLLEQRPE